jgi:putative membrane protein
MLRPMAGFLVRMAISALGLWLASAIVPGMAIEGTWTLLLAALLLGIVNAVVRPVVLLLTLPITVLTLGLFLLVINAAMLGLVAALLDGFALSGFFAALLGSIVVSLTSWVASWYVGPQGRFEVLIVRQGGPPQPPP